MLSSDTSVSALMPVHAGVGQIALRESLESVLNQTVSPYEIVIVEDGPLSVEQRAVLDDASYRHPRVVRVALSENRGAGVANQRGLEAASGEWIAKVDADDISIHQRIEVQLRAVAAAGVDLCGSAMKEFAGHLDNVVSVRAAPLDHRAIGRRMRFNNPVNHPTAFYRRDVALAAGGYPSWRYMQDYGLMARMFSRGARMMNLEEPLVLFRADPGVVRRRQSAEIRHLEVGLQRELRDLGIVGTPQMIANIAWRTAFRLLPPGAVHFVSRRILAKSTGDASL